MPRPSNQIVQFEEGRLARLHLLAQALPEGPYRDGCLSVIGGRPEEAPGNLSSHDKYLWNMGRFEAEQLP